MILLLHSFHYLINTKKHQKFCSWTQVYLILNINIELARVQAVRRTIHKLFPHPTTQHWCPSHFRLFMTLSFSFPNNKECISHYFFKTDFIYLFLERGEGREKERERNIDVWEIQRSVVSRMPPTGALACSPGMCPDWESNRQTFWFSGWHSVHWATPAMADFLLSYGWIIFQRREEEDA